MAATDQLEQLSHIYIAGYLPRDNANRLPPEAEAVSIIFIALVCICIISYQGLKAYNYLMKKRS